MSLDRSKLREHIHALYLTEHEIMGERGALNQHCVRAKNDARDAGPVFRYLRNVTRGRILDLA